MEIVNFNHKIFKTSPPPIANLPVIEQPEIDNNSSSPIPYTEIMLCEYYHLVNALTKLDEIQLQSLQDEVNKVITRLTTWLDKTGPINTIELFSSMRHLKQKANAFTKVVAQKSSIPNKNINFTKPVSYITSVDNRITGKQ